MVYTHLKKLFIAIGILSIFAAGYFLQRAPLFGALQVFDSQQIGTGPVSGEILTTDGSVSDWVTPASLGLGGGDPNVIYSLLGGTLYNTASTTGRAWHFGSGFVSAASSTINGAFTTTGKLTASSTATSTFDAGLEISAGCFSINGVCLSNTDGTVTSVDMSVPTGLTISGNPITTSGTLALALDTGYVIPLSDNLVPNVIYSLLGGTLYNAASTTGRAWHFEGFVSNASSTFTNGLQIGTGGSLMSSSTATSTFDGGISLTRASTTASSTMAGIELYTGCYEQADGVCLNNIFDKPTIHASSTLAYDGGYGTAGTTTYNFWNPSRNVKLIDLYCKTNVGTVWYEIGDYTSSSTVQCTTAGASNSTDVSFTARNNVYEAVGYQASDPSRITVTPTFIWTE